MDPMFPTLPEDLSSLSLEELQALEASHVEAVTLISQQDAEFTAGRDEATILAELRAGVDSLKAIRTAISGFAQAEQNFDEDLQAIAGEVLAAEADDEGDDPAPGDEPEAEAAADVDAEALAAEAEEAEEAASEEAAVEGLTADAEAEEPEAVVAAAPQERRYRRRSGASSTRHAPVVAARPQSDRGAPLLSTLEFGGIRPNATLDEKGKLVQLLDDAIVRTEGITARTVLASARAVFPEERRLTSDFASNAEKIAMLRSQIRGQNYEAVVASGGRCVPLTPRYDLPFIATSRTPVWDSLATNGAERGGITFPTPLGISDVTDGITIVTADEDATVGSATKNCVVVDCDAFQEAETVAIAGCVTHGNFGARSWPERVDNISDLLRVAHAQALEGYLLTAIKARAVADGTALADEAKYGAVSTMLQGIVKAAAMYRNRHRMEPDAVLNSLLPAHVVDLMVVDVNHNAFNRFVARAEIQALLGRYAVNPVFYLDSAVEANGARNMAYGANGATNLDEFKTTIEWALYAPETWIGLDGGRLDLGLVRDSVLNETNDFQLFFETWNGIAKTGIESLWVTSTVCPSGATAPAGTLLTC